MSRRPGSHVDDAPWSGPATGNGGWSRQPWIEAIRYRVGCGGWVCALVVSWWGNGSPRRCGPPVRETFGQRRRMDSCGTPFGECSSVHRPGGNSRTARPTAGITPVVVDSETSLLLEVTHGSHALEATPKQPRRVRECTSRGVRKETAVLRGSAVEIRFGNGLRFLSGRCRPDSTLRGQPQGRYAVCTNHACRGAGRSAAFSLGGV